MKVVKVITSCAGPAMLLFASVVLLMYDIDFILNYSEYLHETYPTAYEWSGLAVLFGFSLAVIGSLIALATGFFVRTFYMRVSLIISGIVYISSCLPIIIFSSSRGSVPVYQELILSLLFLLPGIVCFTSGILFRRKKPAVV